MRDFRGFDRMRGGDVLPGDEESGGRLARSPVRTIQCTDRSSVDRGNIALLERDVFCVMQML
ncbi:MAG: hypothetical protein ACFB9N_03900 [Geitlerinemataceae cyanobacterium]